MFTRLNKYESLIQNERPIEIMNLYTEDTEFKTQKDGEVIKIGLPKLEDGAQLTR